ncbi:MAG: hypothetical protein E5V65_01825 [Mesorhizobium sp.]|nr:MAG: hypothetical protein E5V65_01825 [Mesorhizobium sp.]
MSATHQQSQHPDLEAFADGWKGATGFACGFANKQQQFFRWPDQRPQLEAWVCAQNNRQSAYVGWCLFSEPSRAADRASVLPGILIDLDLASGNHAKKNYAPSATDALVVLRQTALPEPSRIISSGGGLYLHYLFDEPLILAEQADRARAAAVTEGVTAIIRNALRTQGWALDNVSDLARITRPVGSRNWKYDDLRVVELVSETQERLTVADYEMLIGAGAHRRTAERTSATSAVEVERKGGEFALIEKHCGFVRRLAETPQDVSEPEWYAVATLAAHCEDGEDGFHRLSALDSARYREDDTAAKLRHARKVKPRTCFDIETSLGSSACTRCPFKAADMVSPYKLAFGDNKLLELQAQYVLSAQTDSYHPVSGDMPALPAISFNNHFAHRLERIHSLFIHDARSPKVIGTDYVAGDQRLIIQRPDGTAVLNEWRPGGLEARDGSTEVIDEHFALLLPKHQERDWVLDYLAHLLQHPAVKIKHAIMLIGEPGVGKSFINDLLTGLFGEQNVKVDDAAIHASDYKRALGNKQVLIIEEMATSSKWEVTNALKPWFTSEKVVANEKYIRAHEVRSPRGIFIHTNHAVPAVFEPGERRNAVFRIDAPARDQAYYDRLFRMGAQQFSAFKARLLQRDISEWSPNARPPVTEAKTEIIEASRTPVAADIQELLRTDRIRKDLVTVQEAVALLAHPLSSAGGPSSSKVTKGLQELGARKLQKTKLSNGSTVDLWAVRNTQRWLSATHAERKAHYEGVVGPSGIVLGLVEETARLQNV